MIRFIDLRGQNTGYEFAFWDTVTDKFISIGNDQAWDSIDDLVEGATLSSEKTHILDRLVNLCPDWAKEEDGL